MTCENVCDTTVQVERHVVLVLVPLASVAWLPPAPTPVLCTRTGTQVVWEVGKGIIVVLLVLHIQFAKPKGRQIPVERTLYRAKKHNIIKKHFGYFFLAECTVGLFSTRLSQFFLVSRFASTGIWYISSTLVDLWYSFYDC